MAGKGKKRKQKVAVVHCSGGSDLLSGIEREKLPEGCAAIKEAFPDGIFSCRFGCLGGGDCVKACRLHAIHLNEEGAAVIDRDICVGCGLCIKACPQHIIDFMPTEDVIVPKCSNKDKGAVARKQCVNSCIACGICEKNCPADAIHVMDDHAVIDTNRCIACGMCSVKCPRGIICDANGIFTIRR